MKNLIKSIAVVALVFASVSCSKEEYKDYGTVSISKIAEITPEFSNFKEALEVTGLGATLEASGKYTVFVPNDDAFAAILGGQTVADFNADPANAGVLSTILKYHIVSSELLTTNLTAGQTIATMQGQNLTVRIDADGYMYLEDQNGGISYLLSQDVECTNGKLNAVDAVLLPSS